MRERLTVDANVVVYLKDEEHIDEASRLFASFAKGDTDVVAPFYIIYEVPALIQRAIHRKRFSREVMRDEPFLG